ncbi:MAG TPA: hypothetical protein VFV33_14275 [Gemmatimonadaceae bacterium]|nr:hypothetical protein [Gemmatimonadaceae bacterium]
MNTTTSAERRKIRRALRAAGPHQRLRLIRAMWRFHDRAIGQRPWQSIEWATTDALIDLARSVVG